VKGDVGWEEYIQTLMQHSQVYDASRARRSTLNKRIAENHKIFELTIDREDSGEYGKLEFNVHNVDTPIEDLNRLDASQSDLKPTRSRDGPRLVCMSFQAWKELSAEDRLNWDKISEKGKKTILEDGRNKKSSTSRVERRSINNHDFFFNVLEDNDASLSIKVHDSSSQEDNVSDYMLPEELKVNVSDVHKNSDKLLKMATNQTVIKKPAIKKEDKDGIDINQVLSQSSKKGKVSIGKHETIVQRAGTTPFDFEDAPIGTYEVRMHSTKKSKNKNKKKEKLEPTVSETPAPRYNRAFLGEDLPQEQTDGGIPRS
jgi:hypothetical protein